MQSSGRMLNRMNSLSLSCTIAPHRKSVQGVFSATAFPPPHRIGRVEWAVTGRPDKPLKRRFPTAENANG